jgi:hypothetical protein
MKETTSAEDRGAGDQHLVHRIPQTASATGSQELGHGIRRVLLQTSSKRWIRGRGSVVLIVMISELLMERGSEWLMFSSSFSLSGEKVEHVSEWDLLPPARHPLRSPASSSCVL